MLPQKHLPVLFLTLFSAGLAHANGDVKAGYFRVWQGYEKKEMGHSKFLSELPRFMSDTVDLYGGRALSNYLVVIPPAGKPSFVPDELALVALTSESDYRAIRETPAGKAYADRHWDVFDKATSKSAPFVKYLSATVKTLESGTAYDMIDRPIDWSKGYTTVFIGLKKAPWSGAHFLARLKSHIEKTKAAMTRNGLQGYILIANENYEVAYLNWPSKADHDRAGQTPEGKAIIADGQDFMTTLLYAEPTLFRPGMKVTNGNAYHSH